MLETVEGQPVLHTGPLCKYEKKGLISMDLFETSSRCFKL